MKMENIKQIKNYIKHFKKNVINYIYNYYF